jgi:hypothetical protein
MGLINQLNATTGYYWANTEPVDIVSKASPLLWKLMGNAIARDNWEVKAHETVDGGLMIKVPLEYASSNSGSYGKNTVINQSKVDIIDAARFGWAGAYGSNTLNLDDKTQNSGEEAIIDLTKQYMQSIKKAIRIDLASQVIAAAADSDSINGLGDLFNTTTSTAYGSITEAAMADWAASVITTAADISFESIQEVFRKPAMGNFAEYVPDFCVTTQTLLDGYELSLHPQQRYKDSKAVEAGWDNITHKGAPIVADTGVTAGYFYALNLRYLELRAHKDYNFTTPVWVSKEVLGQPDVLSANTRWRGNLLCKNRKLQILRTGLTVATE